MSHALSEKFAKHHFLLQRLFWFMIGAGVSYLLITTPMKYLQGHTDLPIWIVMPCSLAVSTTFFFFWNYFINFRTSARKREALPRYLTAVALMWVLSSSLLVALKHYNAHLSARLGKFPLDLDVIATQFFLSGLKFFLYHKWAFPVPKETPAEE